MTGSTQANAVVDTAIETLIEHGVLGQLIVWSMIYLAQDQEAKADALMDQFSGTAPAKRLLNANEKIKPVFVQHESGTVPGGICYRLRPGIGERILWLMQNGYLTLPNR